MRAPLLLTGPPAAGKSTTARALAASLPLAAVVDVDDVRHLVVAGHAAPWDGDRGRLQQDVGVDNACDLARRFVAAGIAVVLADVVTARTAVRYRERLPGLLVVRLRLPLDEARRRARLRPVHLTEQELDDLHLADAKGAFPVDHVLDVGGLDPVQQVDAVRSLWSGEPPVG
ncbi:AAA family ATPase [Microlunatus capsulatus]|uniref:Kinase n=1 Tax=Microlunatus capsulatus TaxID=99117 RepID=A0ABS4Z3R5_9ACTN|nr:AAA family ATPase [Microlunatus capsulatus]MBP2415347.1 putative kinase [Microlunatus capsulatus]